MYKFNLQGVIDRLEQTKRDLPLVLANQAERFFQDSFKKEGWDNNGITKWQPRKRNRTLRDVTRNILVKSGRLRRSIMVQEANFNRIVIGSDVPYAKTHNDGDKSTVYVRAGKRKGHTRKMNMPKRQFIGNSHTLEQQQIKVITKVLDEIWR